MSLDYRQLMQEKLDRQIEEEEHHALHQHLAKDEKAAQENARLEQIHSVLSSAPQVRAPQRLAATIMARLAQTIEKQAQIQALPMEVRLALMMTTTLISMMMMPSLLAASYLVVNLSYNPQVLGRVLAQIVALQVIMIDALIVLLEEVEELIKKDPQAAPLALALIPVALKGMVDYMQSEADAIQNGEAGHLG